VVSLRKKPQQSRTELPSAAGTPSQGARLPPITGEPQLEQAAPDDNPVEDAAQNAIKQRLEEMHRADTLSRQPPPQPQPQPQFSQRDADFISSRPGIERDSRLQPVAQAFAEKHQYGSPEFYEALENAFPVSDYRTTTKAAPSRQQAPSAPVSAPISREPASWSTGRPASESTTRLTPAETELAGMIGLTPAEYLAGKRRMLEEKKAGFHNER
jgi:hypothetical protein